MAKGKYSSRRRRRRGEKKNEDERQGGFNRHKAPGCRSGRAQLSPHMLLTQEDLTLTSSLKEEVIYHRGHKSACLTSPAHSSRPGLFTLPPPAIHYVADATATRRMRWSESRRVWRWTTLCAAQSGLPAKFNIRHAYEKHLLSCQSDTNDSWMIPALTLSTPVSARSNVSLQSTSKYEQVVGASWARLRQ